MSALLRPACCYPRRPRRASCLPTDRGKYCYFLSTAFKTKNQTKSKTCIPACAGMTGGSGGETLNCGTLNKASSASSKINTPPVAPSRFTSPVKRAEHRRKPGRSPPWLFEQRRSRCEFHGGPGFREAQGTPGAAGGGRARVPGSPFFAYFLWRSKESRSASGTNSRPKSNPARQRESLKEWNLHAISQSYIHDRMYVNTNLRPPTPSPRHVLVPMA